MREKILTKLARIHVNHPWRMLTLVILLTLVFGVLSEHLQVTLRWADLLPSGDRRTVQFNKVIEEFVSSTSIIVVVQGEEPRIKQFADELAPRLVTLVDTTQNSSLQKQIDEIELQIQQLADKEGNEEKIASLRVEINQLKSKMNRKLIRRVDYKTEVDFLKNHGLMLVKEDDLENLKDVYTNPNLSGLLFNINNSMEKEYVGKEESISTRQKEDQAVVFLDGIQNLISLLQKSANGEPVSEQEVHQAVNKFLIGEPYYLSYDKKALILNGIPNFTMFDTDLLVIGTDAVQAEINQLLKRYPDVQAGLTGFVPIGRDEMVYSQQSLGYTTIIALIAILVLLIISFRMWVAPLFAIFNLLIGIVWAIGTATIVVGKLNIMTQMMAVILLGLGIDFSIHIISNFTEWRAAGDSIIAAMEKTFLKSGKGVITGALTTAAAFLTLVISSSRGMKEMGLVTGLGLLAILLTTMLFLPVMLVFRERRLDKRRASGKKSGEFVQRDISFRFLGRTGEWLRRRYMFTILASIIITALLIWSGLNITFDQNYLNVEAKGLTSVALQDTVMDKFDMSMDYAMVITDDIEESRKLAEEYRKMGSVAMTEDISLYLPSSAQQQKRTPHIIDIHESMATASIRPALLADEIPLLTREIKRLEMNIIEMQDMAFLGGQDKVDNKCKKIVGDPDKPESSNIIQQLLTTLAGKKSDAIINLSHLQRLMAPYFKKSVLEMCSTTPIQVKDLPVTVLDRYCNEKRNQFLVTVFPAGNVWKDAQFLYKFVDDLDRVTDKATGMPPVFLALIQVIGRDGRNAMLLTLVIVFLLLWLDFRSVRHALMAMIPLAAGVIWMVGLMHLTGQQFTVMNVMGLPMILGIGIDDGVHIVHRWLHEGRGKIFIVFASTGKAILLTSLTTMLAFGSLIFSIWRGFGHLGAALFVGVGACFLTTVIILSGILGWIERDR